MVKAATTSKMKRATTISSRMSMRRSLLSWFTTEYRRSSSASFWSTLASHWPRWKRTLQAR